MFLQPRLASHSTPQITKGKFDTAISRTHNSIEDIMPPTTPDAASQNGLTVSWYIHVLFYLISIQVFIIMLIRHFIATVLVSKLKKLFRSIVRPTFDPIQYIALFLANKAIQGDEAKCNFEKVDSISSRASSLRPFRRTRMLFRARRRKTFRMMTTSTTTATTTTSIMPACSLTSRLSVPRFHHRTRSLGSSWSPTACPPRRTRCSSSSGIPPPSSSPTPLSGACCCQRSCSIPPSPSTPASRPCSFWVGMMLHPSIRPFRQTASRRRRPDYVK
jgi:hypothetical protein